MKQPSIEKDGFAMPGFAVQAVIQPIPKSDYDMLGREVRAEWIAWAKEQSNPKPSWLVPWEDMSEPDREAYRRIGIRLANIGRFRYVDVG